MTIDPRDRPAPWAKRLEPSLTDPGRRIRVVRVAAVLDDRGGLLGALTLVEDGEQLGASLSTLRPHRIARFPR